MCEQIKPTHRATAAGLHTQKPEIYASISFGLSVRAGIYLILIWIWILQGIKQLTDFKVLYALLNGTQSGLKWALATLHIYICRAQHFRFPLN